MLEKSKPDDIESSSDEEPLAKKSKKPPSVSLLKRFYSGTCIFHIRLCIDVLMKMVKLSHQDVDLEKTVREILDGADLEQVTMKSVCKQVCLVFFLL